MCVSNVDWNENANSTTNGDDDDNYGEAKKRKTVDGEEDNDAKEL